MPESKKVVMNVDIHNDKCRRKALKAVSRLAGIESLSVDMKDMKLTLIGDIDPVDAVRKLKKWNSQIITVGPAKEDEKKDKKKDEEKKKEEEEEKKKKEEEEAIKKCLVVHRAYNPCMAMAQQYCVEEYPNNNCVIS